MNNTIQIKICGLKDPEEARACAELGADAIGCVFYPKSPRNVSDEEARAVVRALPPGVASVGVFVDEPADAVLRRVERCGLTAVQLHGRETPETVSALRATGLRVIKALFHNGAPSPGDAPLYGDASGFLIECAGGVLPGGNALRWNWRDAAAFSVRFPLVLAGGLDAETVHRAVAAALPDAVDVSSGVEAAPGRKDLTKVKRFIDAARRAVEALTASGTTRTYRRIFS